MFVWRISEEKEEDCVKTESKLSNLYDTRMFFIALIWDSDRWDSDWEVARKGVDRLILWILVRGCSTIPCFVAISSYIILFLCLYYFFQFLFISTPYS